MKKENKKVVIWTNCKTQGLVDLGKTPWCDDPDCPPCSTIKNTIIDYVKNMKKL